MNKSERSRSQERTSTRRISRRQMLGAAGLTTLCVVSTGSSMPLLLEADKLKGEVPVEGPVLAAWLILTMRDDLAIPMLSSTATDQASVWKELGLDANNDKAVIARMKAAVDMVHGHKGDLAVALSNLRPLWFQFKKDLDSKAGGPTSYSYDGNICPSSTQLTQLAKTLYSRTPKRSHPAKP